MECEGFFRLREGVWRKPLAESLGWGLQADLIRLDPNLVDRAHIHGDVEWVYVLEGSFSDGRGLHVKGDFVENSVEDVHQVRTGDEGALLFIVWCGKVDVVQE